MAEAQVPSQRLSKEEFSILRTGSSQLPFGIDYSFNTSANFDNSIAGYSMAQPMLHGEFAVDMQTPAQRGSSERSRVPKSETNMAATINNGSNGMVATQGGFYNAADWGNGLTKDYYSIPEHDSVYRHNQELLYNPMAVQTVVDKNLNGYLGIPTWPSSRLIQGPHEVQANELNMEAGDSVSPNSYHSDELGSAITSYSPGQMPNRPCPGTYHGYHTSFQSGKHSPSIEMSLNYPLAMQGGLISTVPGQSMRSRIDPSILVPQASSAKPKYHNSVQAKAFQGIGREVLGLQSGNTSSTSWAFRGYADDLRGQPLQAHPVQIVNAFPNTLTSSFSPHGHGRAQEDTTSLHRSRAAALVQDRQSTRITAAPIVDAQAERKINDDILLQGKLAGHTYKEIRTRLVGNEMPAESTLRGRYRALTKPRKDRVRKPVWTSKDVKLLNEFVAQEFDRLESTVPSSHPMSLEQKLVKVAWKKVAEYITNNGGSYQFGNSTCKRKWMEIHAPTLK